MDLFILTSNLIPRYNSFGKEYSTTKITKLGGGYSIPVYKVTSESIPYYYFANQDIPEAVYGIRFYIPYSEEHTDEIVAVLKKISPLFKYLVADLINIWEDTSITVEGITDMTMDAFLKKFVTIMSGR